MKKNSVRLILLIISGAFLCWSALNVAEGEETRRGVDLGFCINAIEKVRTERFLVEYEMFAKGGGPYHRLLAMAAPGSLYELSAHFPEGGYTWQSDPYAQEYFLQQGNTCHAWPFSRIFHTGTLERGKPVPGSFAYEPLLRVLPFWILSDYEVPPVFTKSEIPVTILEALRSGQFTLSPQTEIIGGEECVIFERKGADRIYLAQQKGYCLMRRDICDPASAKLRQRIITDKTICVASNLWLPSDYTQQYFFPDPDHPDQIIEEDAKVHVIRYLINHQVPEQIFVPSRPAGSMEFYSDRDPVQVVPGGLDLLDRIVNLTKVLRLPKQPLHQAHKYVWLIGGVVTGMLAGGLTAPRKRNPRHNNPIGRH